jgi:D-amino peptidase
MPAARKKSRAKKVLIFTDLEGASGLVSARGNGDIGTEGTPEYQQYRRFLTQDVNAAVEGALAAGATEIIVNDAHGTIGHNVLPAELHKAAYLERPVPGNWAPGLDAACRAVFVVGAHAMAGTVNGFLDHTQSSQHIFHWFLNNIRVGELGQLAAIAGHFNVPIALVTGDRAATLEAKKLLGPAVETVAVKEGLSRNYARGLHPAAAQELIRQSAQRALEQLGKMQPWKIKSPVTMRVVYCRADYAEDAYAKGGQTARRLDARTVEKKLPDPTWMFRGW